MKQIIILILQLTTLNYQKSDVDTTLDSTLALNVNQGKTLVLEGTLNEEGTPSTTLSLPQVVNVGGSGELVLRNIILDTSDTDIAGQYLIGTQAESTGLEIRNVTINITSEITQGNGSPIFTYSPNSDIVIDHLTIEDKSNVEGGGYGVGLQLFQYNSVEISNTNIIGSYNPLTTHYIKAGSSLTVRDSNFTNSKGVLMIDNSILREKTVEAEYEALLAEYKATETSINFENVNITSNRNYFGYMFLDDMDGTKEFQANASWLTLSFINSTLNTQVINEELVNSTDINFFYGYNYQSANYDVYSRVFFDETTSPIYRFGA